VENLLAINTHAKPLETSGRNLLAFTSFIIGNEEVIKKLERINLTIISGVQTELKVNP
jgi:hypothetical protein